jgi:hypothetical protein
MKTNPIQKKPPDPLEIRAAVSDFTNSLFIRRQLETHLF